MKKLLLGTFFLASLSVGQQVYADTKSKNLKGNQVIVSVKPIHSLVAGVMKGIGRPHLIIKTGASPHTYRMKPSDGNVLENAKIVFWVGPELESFLKKPIKTIATKSHVVSLLKAKGLIKFKPRKTDIVTQNKHDEHDKHDVQDAHDKHDHGDLSLDPHVWLDPQNAKIMTKFIAIELSNVDPKNAVSYQRNARRMVINLDKAIDEIGQNLKIDSQKKYLVFHDAYQYFEKRFGLNFSGAVVANTHKMSGAKRLKKIQQQIKNLGVSCVFFEPQFNPRLINMLASGRDIKTIKLDPMGASLEPGPNLYFKLLSNMSMSFRNCFK